MHVHHGAIHKQSQIFGDTRLRAMEGITMKNLRFVVVAGIVGSSLWLMSARAATDSRPQPSSSSRAHVPRTQAVQPHMGVDGEVDKYFLDAEMTQRIGWERWGCGGGHTAWGTLEGPYMSIRYFDCGGPPPGADTCHKFVDNQWIEMDCPADEGSTPYCCGGTVYCTWVECAWQCVPCLP